MLTNVDLKEINKLIERRTRNVYYNTYSLYSLAYFIYENKEEFPELGIDRIEDALLERFCCTPMTFEE